MANPVRIAGFPLGLFVPEKPFGRVELAGIFIEKQMLEHNPAGVRGDMSLL